MKIWQLIILSTVCSILIGLTGGLASSYMIGSESNQCISVSVNTPKQKCAKTKCPTCSACKKCQLPTPLFVSRYKDESSGEVIESLRAKNKINLPTFVRAFDLATKDPDVHAILEYYDFVNFMDTKPKMTPKAWKCWKILSKKVTDWMEKNPVQAIKGGFDITPLLQEAELAAL